MCIDRYTRAVDPETGASTPAPIAGAKQYVPVELQVVDFTFPVARPVYKNVKQFVVRELFGGRPFVNHEYNGNMCGKVRLSPRSYNAEAAGDVGGSEGDDSEAGSYHWSDEESA